MKKLLSITLVLVLALATLLVTACNKNKVDNEDDSYSSYSSIEEESSSERHRGDGASSNTGDNSQSNIGGGSSSDDRPINSSSDNPNTSFSDKPQTSSSVKYDDYDYSYSTSVVMPTDMSSSAGILDSLLYVFVEDFPKPVLTDGFYATLADYERQYNALTAMEKASVQNYPVLLEARNAYNNMAKRECEKLINDLPDATINNLTEFGTLANAIAKLVTNLGSEANSIPNKSVYDTKVASADSLLIDTFNQKVTAIQTFEYTAEYKAKLDEADTIYSLMNTAQQSKVAASKSALENKKTMYQNTTIAKEFETKVLALPEVANLTDEHKATVLELKNTYSKLTTEQQNLISQDVKTKFGELEKWFVGGRIAYIFSEEYAKTGQSSWTKQAWTAKNTPSQFVLSGSLSYNNSSDVNLIFEGVNYNGKGVNRMKNATITVQINSPTVFVICCNLKAANKTCTLTVSKDGTAIPELTTPLVYSTDGTNCEYRFNLDSAGTWVISLTDCNDSVRVAALAMY